MEFKKTKRRPFLDLQLTAMIDMFSIIIIFLILGTAMSTTDIHLPPQMFLPFSGSRENAESAPRIEILKQSLKVPFLKDLEVPLSEFKLENTERLLNLENQLKQFQNTRANEKSRAGILANKKLLLNVMADSATPYEHIFDVAKFFRQRGFETLLFVAVGE